MAKIKSSKRNKTYQVVLRPEVISEIETQYKKLDAFNPNDVNSMSSILRFVISAGLQKMKEVNDEELTQSIEKVHTG